MLLSWPEGLEWLRAIGPMQPISVLFHVWYNIPMLWKSSVVTQTNHGIVRKESYPIPNMDLSNLPKFLLLTMLVAGWHFSLGSQDQLL